jgi:FkbM family methyltransferase
MIKRALKGFLNPLFKRVGLRIVQSTSIDTYEAIASDYQQKFRSGEDIPFLLSLPPKAIPHVLQLVTLSKSQIRQDLFVLTATDFKRSGYFVEFGATDGYSLSNSYLLEKEFGWTGIVAEPARMWQQELRANRTANVSTACVWSETGSRIEFSEVSVPELSTANKYIGIDSHANSRKISKTYLVDTISLNDLLVEFDAPSVVDYLSIDTEGSEFLILSNLDFSKWKFQVITVEHNFTDQRMEINDLLTSHGYERVCPEVSQFDDWYLSAELAEKRYFVSD